MATEQQPHLSILRIKRRRTDNPTPLDALVIETPEPSTKRRRANGPTKAGAESQADAGKDKAAPGARGIFRFAETVPLDSFSSLTKTRNLKDRIQSFLAHPPHARSVSSPLSRIGSSTSLRSAFRRSPPSTATGGSSAPPSPIVTNAKTASPSGRKLPSSLRAARAAAAANAAAASTSGADSPSRRSIAAEEYHDQARQLRYRIVAQQRDKLRAEERRKKLEAERERRKEEEEVRRGLRPPRVLDSRELAREKEERERKEREGAENDSDEEEELKIYEAVAEAEASEAETDQERERRRRKRDRQKARVARAARGTREEDQQEEKMAMDQFGDMLREYLTLQDSISPSSPSSPSVPAPNLLPFPLPSTSTPNSASLSSSDTSDDDDENDYVYDVYYRAVPPTSGPSTAGEKAESDKTEEAATQAGSGAWDVSSLEGLKRIGQLAGFTDPLTDPADLADELLMHEQEGDLSSEEEDEADQDSNEENDYRNDYPEGEDQPFSSDEEDDFGAIPARRTAGGAAVDSDELDEDEDSDGDDQSDEEDMRMSGGGFGGGGRFGGWRGRGGGEGDDDDAY
ncbi:hypothetical protein JCM11251_001950 [Rhodosporidiobolus azoricus]